MMFLHNLFAVGAFIAGRSVRDALFLTHASLDSLAWMYVASALAVATVGLAYTHIASRFRRDHLAAVSGVVFAVGYAFAFSQRGAPQLYPVLYVSVEVMGALALVQFWTLLNELFHAREARRLYGLIGAGGMVANIVVGLATRSLARWRGAEALLWLCAVLCLGVAVAAFLAGRVGRERLFARAVQGARSPRPLGGGTRVWRSGHLRMVAILAALTFVTTTCVDFEFKAVAARSLTQDALAAYFGGFYAVVGVFALGLQLFGTGRLLNRLGVVSALAVLPVALAAGNLTLALWGTLWAAAAVKGADSLFRYTVNDATTQLLYLPVPANTRATAKAFIDGVVKSAAVGMAGLLLLCFRELFRTSPQALALLALALCAVWGAVVAAIRGGYIRTLEDALRNRRGSADEDVPLPLADAATNLVLLRALDSSDTPEVLAALELLPRRGTPELDDRVERLLSHPAGPVRHASLTYFGHRMTVRHANAIFRCFDDDIPAIRARAVETFCTIGKDKAVRSLRPLLDDPEPGVRGAAISGMIRFGGLDGVMEAAEALKTLICHPESRMRLHAARVLGAIGVRNFYQPVLELMNDEDDGVRREAIAAAGVLQSPEFVLPLIYKTQSPETSADAVNALCAFGPSIVHVLGKVLGNSLEEVSIRRSVARVLGRLGSTEAVQLLTPHLTEPDDELRTRVQRALAKAVRSRRLGSRERRAVETALELELLRAFRALAAAETLQLEPPPGGTAALSASALLGLALAEKVAAAEERIFLLLGVLYPNAGMEHIYVGIRDASEAFARRRRANAVELLDNLLSRSIKRRLLPLFDELPRAEKLSAVASLMGLSPRPAEDVRWELCRDDNPWVRACALNHALSLGPAAAREELTAAVEDMDPIVRETALGALRGLLPAEALAFARKRLKDDSPVVRELAESILLGSRLADGVAP